MKDKIIIKQRTWVTLRVGFGDPNKTLTKEDIKPIREKIIKLIKESGGILKE